MVFLQQKDLEKNALGRITLGPLECVEASKFWVINKEELFLYVLHRTELILVCRHL